MKRNMLFVSVSYGILIGSLTLIMILFIHHNTLIFEIISSFAVHLVFSCFIICIILLLLKRSIPVFISLIVLVILMIIIFQETGILRNWRNDACGKSIDFSILQANVYLFNRNKVVAIDTIINKDPDIITFHEIDKHWSNVLQEELSQLYPYSRTNTGRYFGTAIYSKYPIKRSKSYYIDKTIILYAELNLKNRIIDIITFHSYAPTNRKNLFHRNKQLKELIPIINKCKNPTIVTGDFNTVPWTWIMRKVRNETGLTDSRKSLLFTYPARGFFQVPIDYILNTKEFNVLESFTINLKTSDHLGLLTKYLIK